MNSAHNQTLERDRATCAAFWKLCGSRKFDFYLSFWGLKARPARGAGQHRIMRQKNDKTILVLHIFYIR